MQCLLLNHSVTTHIVSYWPPGWGGCCLPASKSLQSGQETDQGRAGVGRDTMRVEGWSFLFPHQVVLMFFVRVLNVYKSTINGMSALIDTAPRTGLVRKTEQYCALAMTKVGLSSLLSAWRAKCLALVYSNARVSQVLGLWLCRDNSMVVQALSSINVSAQLHISYSKI